MTDPLVEEAREIAAVLRKEKPYPVIDEQTPLPSDLLTRLADRVEELQDCLNAAVAELLPCGVCGKPHAPHRDASNRRLAPQWGAEDGHAYRPGVFLGAKK